MKIQINKNLQVVADRAGMDVNEMSTVMATTLLNAGLIKADEEYYGVTVAECNGQSPVATIIDVMHEIGIKNVNDTTFDAFAACVIMGDGNCPDCGGELCLSVVEGHVSNDDGYITPKCFIEDWYIYECPVCGKTIKTKKEL